MNASAYPHGDPAWFVHDRFGMFIHWGIYALPARHEWIQSRECISPEVYRRYFDHFDPDLYDPAAWARLAREAGMRYVVVTAKHHDGFCLWDTAHTDYKATNTPHGRDLLRPLVEAFRAEGLRIGFYYSLLDWHHPDYPIDQFHPLRDNPDARATNSKRDVRRYAAYMRDQVTELLTDFGRIDLLWFDFSFPGEDGKGRDDWESEAMIALVRRLMPDVLLDNRLDLPGSGNFITPEQYQPAAPLLHDDGTPAVWEACQTFSGSWGYHREEMTWKSEAQLLFMLIDGVSKNGNLLLNVGPNARGELDPRAVERLEGIARWMRLHERSIRGCVPAPEGIPTPPDSRLTYNPQTNRLYLHILHWPYRHMFVEGLAERVAYAQFLHDGSEVRIDHVGEMHFGGNVVKDPPLALHLPVIQPPVTVPVVELFLR